MNDAALARIMNSPQMPTLPAVAVQVLDLTSRRDVELAEIAAADPEVILLPDEPYRFDERHRETLRPLGETAAWRNSRIHLVDGKALFWYGPRTPGAIRLFSALLRA